MAVEAHAGTRWALLIGINRYPLLPGHDLRGCVNDVTALGGVLRERFGFLPENTTLLLDEAATRDGILQALDALVDRVAADDVVVLAYAGHGSQMRDREGDEADGLDETLVAHDSGRGVSPNRDITDDELHVRLSRLGEKTPHVTVILDCCHSGSGTRDPFGDLTRGVPPDLRPISELPPSPLLGSRGAQEAPDRPAGQRHVLLAGCRDDERSYEHTVATEDGEIRHGALTFFLLRELVRAAPGETVRDIFERVRPQVTAAHPAQHPLAEGQLDHEIFGVRHLPPMRFVPVADRVGRTITLGGGVIHGLAAGSQFSVYPTGTREVTPGTPALGRVEVTAVRSVTAEASVLEETREGSIAAGDRAVAEVYTCSELIYSIEIHAAVGCEAAASALVTAQAQAPLLSLAPEGVAARARVYALGPRQQAQAGDPVPQLGALPVPTWVVAGRDGHLLLPPLPVDAGGGPAESAAQLIRDLEILARQHHIAALDNPDPTSPMRGALDLGLLRRSPAGEWVPAEPDDQGRVPFTDGDLFALEVFSRYSRPVYIGILDLGLTGRVDLLHPPEGAMDALGPGVRLRIGQRSDDEMNLYLPDTLPPLADASAAQVGYQETLKLIASTEPIDLQPLLQGGHRALDAGGDTVLGRVLDLALGGTREVRIARKRPGEDWTAVTRVLSLRPRSAL